MLVIHMLGFCTCGFTHGFNLYILGYLFAYLLKKFNVNHFLKFFAEFITILYLFHVLVFSHKACDIFIPGTGIEPIHPDLEAEV